MVAQYELSEGQKTGGAVAKGRNVAYAGVPAPLGLEDDDRAEKPWQRVARQVARKGTHLYEPVASVPGAALLLLLGWYLLLGYLAQLTEDAAPAAVPDAAVPRDSWDTFSEEAALRYLGQLLGGAPRVAGTRHHLQKTGDLKRLLDDIAARARLPVRTDWQLASGDYWLDFSPPHVNAYQNVSNVVALLEGRAGPAGPSLLVNCHYDSVPFAIGASDNGLFCAVMLETLSRLSQRAERLRHNIVFLFNGAEENPLQGSHAFLSHPWARGLVSVVNLDAAGMNGRPTVFQASDPRVLGAYRRAARRPSAQGLGEFLFASGVIPSDTDFRIWRDFAHIHGIDIAFVKWGVVYHTRYDRPELLRAGVAQGAGDMLLALLPALADMPELEQKEEPSAAVYWDYLGWFMAAYGAGAAGGLDAGVALLGLLSVAHYVWLVGWRWSSVRELALAAAGRLASAAAGLLVVVVTTALMVATTVQLRYLSEPWLVVPLYWLPYLLGAVLAAHAFDAWRSKKSGLSRSVRALQAAAATRLLLSLALLAASGARALAGVRYALALPLLLAALLSAGSATLLRCVRLAGWQHLLLEAACSAPAALFLLSLALRLDATLLPALGRSSSPRPDYTAALVNAGLAALVATAASGIELLFSRRRLWLPAGALAAACAVAMLLPLAPYRDAGPATQRHSWFHTEIVSHDPSGRVVERVAGVLVTPLDPYTVASARAALARAGLAADVRTDFREDCARHVFCNLPLYRLRFAQFLPDSMFIYMAGPAPFEPAPALRVTSRRCEPDACTLDFSMIGPAHNTLTVWPHAGVALAAWSLASPLRASLLHAGRPLYVVVHSTATYSDVFEPFNFTLTFTGAGVGARAAGALAALAQHAHRAAHPEHHTAAFARLLAAAPPYFHVASFMTLRHNYLV